MPGRIKELINLEVILLNVPVQMQVLEILSAKCKTAHGEKIFRINAWLILLNVPVHMQTLEI